MGKAAKAVVRAWHAIGHVSIAHWLWTLIPAGGVGVVTGWVAALEGLPVSLVIVFALGASAFTAGIAAIAQIYLSERLRHKRRIARENAPSALNERRSLIIIDARQGVQWARIAGLDVSREKDACYFAVSEVFLSNPSSERHVTLSFSLRIFSTEMEVNGWTISGEGKDIWGRKMGEHDSYSVRSRASGLPVPEYLTSPVTIPPLSTVSGKMIFVEQGFAKNIGFFAKLALSADVTYSLQVREIVSGQTFEMAVPGRYPPSS